VLKEPCVDAIAHAAWVIGKADPGDRYPNGFYSMAQVSLDLDEDRSTDMVVWGGASRQEVTYHLYVRRGECGYYVGTVPSSEPLRTESAKSHGLHDVRSASDECPKSHKMSYCEATWRFDGTKYQVRSEKEVPRQLRGGVP
jgi:hypothetical protein